LSPFMNFILKDTNNQHLNIGFNIKLSTKPRGF